MIRHGCRLLVVATLLFSSLGMGHPPPGLTPSDKKSIDDLIVDYMRAFSARDYGKLRDCFQVPFVRGTGGAPEVFPTLDGVIASYHASLDLLDKRGYASSKPQGIARISILAPDQVL